MENLECNGGFQKGQLLSFLVREREAKMGRWGEIGLSGWTLRVFRMCVSERSRSLPNRREG